MKQKSKNMIKWLPFIAAVIWFVYYATKGTIECYQLKKRGKCTYAYVSSKKSGGGKGHIRTEYNFKYNGEYYNGYSYHDNKAKIGDFIIVVFLESNPNINRGNTLLKKDCDSSLPLVY